MAYFTNFPQVIYRFGNNEQPVSFQILNTYVDILDNISSDINVYEKYTILPGDRADTLSFQLYGDSQFYWTFFLVNEKLRESGWPLDQDQLYSTAKVSYPHRMITTKTDISDTNFKIGQTVTGSQSGSTGKIVEVNLDLGQVVVDSPNNFNSGESVSVGTGGDTQTLVVLSDIEQYNGVHHYEDSNKEWVDIDPHTQVTTGYTPVTYIQRFSEFNDNLREINVLTPNVLRQVSQQFQELVRG